MTAFHNLNPWPCVCLFKQHRLTRTRTKCRRYGLLCLCARAFHTILALCIYNAYNFDKIYIKQNKIKTNPWIMDFHIVHRVSCTLRVERGCHRLIFVLRSVELLSDEWCDDHFQSVLFPLSTKKISFKTRNSMYWKYGIVSKWDLKLFDPFVAQKHTCSTFTLFATKRKRK